METIVYGFSDSPFGEIIVAATAKGICDLQFPEHNKMQTIRELGRRWGVYTPTTIDNEMAATVAAAIFDHTGTPLAIDLRGTAFQLGVWREVLNIPPGKTASYPDIACRMGVPGSVRAVASAIARNPIAMLVPCHRVVHSDGSPGEYHWGKDLKRRLLEWESGKNVQAPLLTVNTGTTPLTEEMSGRIVIEDVDELF